MGYVVQVWIDHVVDETGAVVIQGTRVDSAHLTHMEYGIKENSDRNDSQDTQIEGLQEIAEGLATLIQNIINGTQKVGSASNADSAGSANTAATATTATSATKLANARSISVTGGATAAGVSFDGTKNIALNITSLSPEKMSQGVLGGKIQGNATAQAEIANAQVRDISVGTDDLQEGVSVGQPGTLYGFFKA